MDELDVLIGKFDKKKNTHRELSLFWIHYLQIKKQRMNNLINKANELLQNMEDYEDISMEDLTRVYIITRTLFG